MSGGTETVPCPTGAERLDRLLAGLQSVGSRRRARDIVESGKVTLNGKLAAVDHLGMPVTAGTQVQIAWNKPGTSKALSKSLSKADRKLAEVGLKILYQDAEVVCVDKPAGLLTDTATREQEREDDSAKKRLDTWLAARDEKAWVCHRIDRDTSGVVVFARNEKAFNTLRESFANHVPDRFYWVAVFGIVIGDAGVWEDSMVWDPKIKRQVAVPIQTPGAVMARAEWRVIERHPVATLLEVKLDTGRRNQIRVHAALRGHPLVGEKIYLPPRSPQPLIRFPRQALHAWRIGFPHPTTGVKVEVEAELPADLVALREHIRKMSRG